MNATQKTDRIRQAIERRFHLWTDRADVNALRRAEMTLHRWAEAECGDGSGWALERDEITGKPYRWLYSERMPLVRHTYPVPDREAGALKRIARICETLGLHYFHQTDPRGCALYVGAEPLTATNYTNGVAVCA